jgi:E3 ubiquitin-protein ligase HUWE1
MLNTSKAIVKLFHARRNPDTAQRKQIMSSSTAIADIMLKHISQKNFGEPFAKYRQQGMLKSMIRRCR